MRRHSSRTSLLAPALGAAAALLASGVLAGEALPDRPGFGHVIEFAAGPGAEASLPVVRQPLPDRPGFGDVIAFLPGDPADELYPRGRMQRRNASTLSQR